MSTKFTPRHRHILLTKAFNQRERRGSDLEIVLTFDLNQPISQNPDLIKADRRNQKCWDSYGRA